MKHQSLKALATIVALAAILMLGACKKKVAPPPPPPPPTPATPSIAHRGHLGQPGYHSSWAIRHIDLADFERH
jgi:hypothetical protein